MFPTLLVLLSVATLSCALHLPVDPEFLLKKGPINNRVIGGVDTPIEKIPWQVSVQRNGSPYCGGVIYSKNIIITAAHCVDKDYPMIYGVRVGSSTSINGGSVIKVAKITVHDRFTLDPIIEYDIALILLSSPLEMGPTVKAIPLAESVPDDGASAIVSGWGWTTTETNPLHLQSGNVTILSREKCARVHGDRKITKVTVCAASPGSCHGDSGGPLVFNDELVGIVSYGEFYCPPNIPGVYTNVVELRKWIEEEAKNLSSI
ncbi:hypodermin-A-like [Drosophila sulfurigaster albostrigata]|uniref:hypodermin-A-like n=1 Tax=Drosophila sulfurigaster albostrigata TaxID=89887 RepID=UPI002D21CEF5|nr:hypodermin-A-like [Drosophila sulfurigaster albostrigata]